MSLKHGLLGLLSYEPMTGYELDKEFSNSLGNFWQAKTSQIYRELDDMQKKGWLTSERVIQDDKPNKRVYSLTAEGKAKFMEWLASPEEDIKNAMQVKSAFLMRIFFAGDGKREDALNMLTMYREVCLRRIRAMEEAVAATEGMKGQFPELAVYWQLTAMHGEIMAKARLEWVEKAIGML